MLAGYEGKQLNMRRKNSTNSKTVNNEADIFNNTRKSVMAGKLKRKFFYSAVDKVCACYK